MSKFFMNWNSVCGAVPGRGHTKKNLPCQDKVARREEHGVHVIALADGLSRKKFCPSCFGVDVANRGGRRREIFLGAFGRRRYRLLERDGLESSFILMSDGSEQSLYNKRNKTLAPAVKRLMHRATLIDAAVLKPQLEQALSKVVAENTHDDCSVAILARNSDQLPPLEDLPLSERLSLFQIANDSALCSNDR